MAPRNRIQVVPASDYRGGINYVADPFQLREDEVSEAMDVDFDPSGGFARRKAIQAINTTALGSTPKNLWQFNSADGTYKHIVVQDGNDAAYTASTTGASWTAINPDALTTSGQMHAAQAGDKLYIQRNAERAAFTWNGTATAVLADSHGAYVDNLAAPTAGHMPLAKYITYHSNYLFHANTVESSAKKGSRLRFSHPASDLTATRGFESYRTNDWIDVAPDDGDEITGIVSWKQRLIIFKNKSVWQLLGFSPDSFQLENISHTVGAVAQSAIALGDEGIYFFSWPQGLQLWDGRQIQDLWYRMSPLTQGQGSTIDSEVIDATRTTNTTVGYLNQRCWVSVTTNQNSGTTNDRVFIFDPRLSKAGGWTKYNAKLGPFMNFHPPGGDVYFLACHANAGYVETLDRYTGYDGLTASAGSLVNTAVQGYCYTAWYDLDNPALVKRWKHPIFVCDAEADMTLNVKVYRDYDFYGVSKTFDITIDSPGTGMVWGTGVWGTGVWGGGLASPQVIERGASIGRGTAIALKVTGPSVGNLSWAVNSISYKFLPRRIRA